MIQNINKALDTFIEQPLKIIFINLKLIYFLNSLIFILTCNTSLNRIEQMSLINLRFSIELLFKKAKILHIMWFYIFII